MHLASLVEMVESGFDERVLLGTHADPVTGTRFGQLVRTGASTLPGYTALVYAGENHPLLPVALFSAAWAGIPFVPVNYRLEDHQLIGLVQRQPGALVLADEPTGNLDPANGAKVLALLAERIRQAGAIGILVTPLMASISEDSLRAVPSALREASTGLGARRSTTVIKVVLPAAISGIVAALLISVSRAIGETMVVTMGAGAAAKLSLNPFEAMTTMTVKIVSQLTGDTDFAAPETLVAFALGMTLFVLTLGLNIVALQIVRKYKEQYE